MADIRVVCYGIGREWQALEGRMEVCYTVLRQQADEVQAPDGVFALRGREHRTVLGSGWPFENESGHEKGTEEYL